MKKSKVKRSNPINKKNPRQTIFSNPEAVHLLCFIGMTELAQRLSKCILALQEYDSFPTQSQMIDSISDTLNKGIQKGSHEIIFPIKKHDWSFMEKYQIAQEVFDSVFRDLGNENIHEKQSLELCLKYCVALFVLCDEGRFKMTDDEKGKFNILEHLVIGKSNEVIGYWTAKLEMMKQNKNNVKIRTTKKDDRKTELKEWMKTMKAREYRLKAQQKWGVSERTVLHYEQEIRGEKTPIMRKKADIA